MKWTLIVVFGKLQSDLLKNNSSGNTNDLIFGLTEKRYQRKKWAFLRFYRLIINETGSNPYFENIERRCQKRVFFGFFFGRCQWQDVWINGGAISRKVCFSFRKAHLLGNQIYLFKSVTRYLSQFRSFVWKWNLYGWKVGHEVAIPSFSYIISYANAYSRLGVQRRGRDDILY